MGLFERLSRMNGAVKGWAPVRLLLVLAAGTLGQRVTLVLGLGVSAFALFKALPWFALATAGSLLCWFALRDYDRNPPRDPPA